jgi:hypothetical protein
MASGSIFTSQFQPVHVAPGRALASFAVNPAIASSTLWPEYSSATSATEAALGTEKRDAERFDSLGHDGGAAGGRNIGPLLRVKPCVARRF